MHAQSGYYLDAFSESNEYQSFSLQLSTFPTFSSLFTIAPMYNTMSIDDTIQTSDPFRIKNVKTSYSLDYTLEKGYTSYADLNLKYGFSKDKTVYDLNYGKEDLNGCSVILTERGETWSCKLIRAQRRNSKGSILANEICRLALPHFSSELAADYSYLVIECNLGRQG